MIATLAMIDVIGMEQVLFEPNGADAFSRIWHVSEAWSGNLPTENLLSLIDDEFVRASVHVTAISDSVLMDVEPEIEIRRFHELVNSLTLAIEAEVGGSYAIVSRGEYLPPSTGSVTGASTTRRSGRRAFSQSIGTGEAWVCLYMADRKLAGKRNWHDRHNLYCIGDGAFPDEMQPADSENIDTPFGSRTLYTFSR